MILWHYIFMEFYETFIYFRLFTSFWRMFLESLIYLCFVEMLMCNFNSIAANNFSKVSLLEAYNAIHIHDIICLLETYLKHDTLFYDGNLWIPEYKLTMMMIMTIIFSPRKIINVSYLKDYLNFSLSVNGRHCDITLIYHSPSQFSDEFHKCLTSFELLLDNIANRNPLGSIIIGDFMARSKNGFLLIKQLAKVKNWNFGFPMLI